MGTDASPWGVGGWLSCNGSIKAYFSDVITEDDQRILRTPSGVAEGQQTWEALAMLVGMRVWKRWWQSTKVSLAIRGDNTGALHLFAALKGRSRVMNLIARELALDLGDGAYFPEVVEHIPGIANNLADALSRVAQPSKKTWQLPAELLDVKRDIVPKRDMRWWSTLKANPAVPGRT